MRVIPKEDIIRDFKRGVSIIQLVAKYRLDSRIIWTVLEERALINTKRV